jgi:tetratricopeptide (TPR) repeat protein
MKNILIALATIYLLTGCGSDPKSGAAGAGDEGYSPTTGGELSFDLPGENKNAPGKAAASPAKSAPVTTTAQAIVPTSQSTLVDAIKSQNDEQIYRVSGQLLTQNSTDVKALNAMAMYYFKKGKIPAAKYLLNKAAAANPNVGEVYGNIGLVHLANDEPREAIKAFGKALALNPKDGIAAANAGSIYVMEKDYNKAVTVLSVAYNQGIKDPKTLNNYAVALTAVGKFDDASAIYSAAIKEQNNNRELLLNHAILLIDHMNKNKEGIEVLNRLKFIGPPSESRNRIIALENKAKAGVK